MDSWLAAGIESVEDGLPGRIIDIHVTPADLLQRDDIGLCLASGVAVGMGSTPIGYIPGTVLRDLLRQAFLKSESNEKTARKDAERHRRNQQVLAASLSHELRTPVSAISGYSELIALGLAHGRTVSAAEQNAVIWEAAQSLLGTIDSILDIAGIESGEARLVESRIDVEALFKVVARMLATLASARGVTIRISVAPDLPELFADIRMLRQILVNLVSNAIKYGADKGRATISAAVDKRGRMIIEVRDRGDGISEDSIESAMQPFKRLTARADMIPGSGLGLPLVKALVELHEGEFKLLSARGKGTRAIVMIPAGRVLSTKAGQQESFTFQRLSSNILG